nr:putative reverse transcriptase domain-containing protein [Tanacetum cinerariifolium]
MSIGLDLPKQILDAQTEAMKQENLKHKDGGYHASEPVTAVAFPAAAVVRTQAQHEEAIRGILEHMQGVPIEEDMSTLRFRMGMADENASLRGKIKTIEAIKMITRSQEKRARNGAMVGFSSGVTATRPRELQEAPGTEAKKLENLKHKDVGGMIRKDIPKEKLEIEVHNTFHVSNLKKCYADEPLSVLLDGPNIDDKLHFVEEPVEIIDYEVKRLKQSRIPIIKVRLNSRRGPEFTWEREDQFQKKYPHLFTKTAPSSSAAS